MPRRGENDAYDRIGVGAWAGTPALPASVPGTHPESGGVGMGLGARRTMRRMAEPAAAMSLPEARSPRAQRKLEAALGYRLFAALGWGDLGDGHISARDPERPECFWMLDVGVAFADATPEAMVLIDPDGQLASAGRGANWPGYCIHQPVLAARPEVASVAHTHTPFGTPFAAEARLFEPITQEACVFVDDHALFDDDEVQVQDLDCGHRIAGALGGNRGLVLRNHGLLTVGATVPAAVAWFVMMERVAQAHLTVRQPQAISHNAALYAKADLATEDQAQDAFEHLVRHHLRMAAGR